MKAPTRYSSMNATRWLAFGFGIVALAACKDLDVPNLNSPGLQDFENNPTRSQVLSSRRSPVRD
ncbi:MAG: hypothetical protein DMD73_15130 [Gemmatimonadetes bacterium]|nr:MAG: hypothetical protein DMD73_15130 [Gemmatimonadota bacterium]